MSELNAVSDETRAKLTEALKVREIPAGTQLTVHAGRPNEMYLLPRGGNWTLVIHQVDPNKPTGRGDPIGESSALRSCNDASWLHWVEIGKVRIEALPSVAVVVKNETIVGVLPPLCEIENIPNQDLREILIQRIKAYAKVLLEQDRREISRGGKDHVPNVKPSMNRLYEVVKKLPGAKILQWERKRAYNPTSGAPDKNGDRQLPCPKLIMVKGYGWILMKDDILNTYRGDHGKYLYKGMTGEVPGQTGGEEGDNIAQRLKPAAILGKPGQHEASMLFHSVGLTGEEPPAVFFPLEDCEIVEVPIEKNDIQSLMRIFDDLRFKTSDMTHHNTQDELDAAELTTRTK